MIELTGRDLPALSGLPDDGVVETSSAKGVPGAFIPETDPVISVSLAHLQMTRDDGVYEQVMGILRGL